MNKSVDTFVLIICGALMLAFVYILPSITELVKNSASNQEIEEEKFPISYYCERNVDNNMNAVIKQKATYTLKDKIITYAHINRTYVFEDENKYLSYKEAKQNDDNEITGVSIEYEFDDNTKTVEETIKKDIALIPERDMEKNFPRTYENLLIYTKGQKCSPTYEE